MIGALRGALATAVLLGCGQEPSVAPVVARPGPAALNAACERCHVPEAIQWRQSLHRAAFDNDAFARSFAREPKPFCQGCHAPHADPQRPPPAWAAENGVTCIACHGAEVVRAAGTPRSHEPAPHALLRGGDFDGAGACASCHEFDFPVSRQHPPGRKMQLTATEHARSEFADVGCAACHMASSQRRRDHRFVASRAPALLRAALSVTARRSADDRVQLQLAPVGVGHAFPTGDLFRRIELRVEARDGHGEIVGQAIRHLARQFPARRYTGPDADRPDPIEADDRLTGPTSIEMLVPGATDEHSLKWRVTYQRVDRRDPIDPERSSLAGAVVLAEGTLGP